MFQRPFIGLGLCAVLAALTGCGGSGEEPAGNSGNAGASGSGGTGGGGTSCPTTPTFDFAMTPRTLDVGHNDESPLYTFEAAGGHLFFKRYSHASSSITTPLLSIPTQGGEPQEILPEHGSYGTSGSDVVVAVGSGRLVRIPQAGGAVTELPPIVHRADGLRFAGNMVLLDETLEWRKTPTGDDEPFDMYITHDIETGAEKEIGSIWAPLDEFVVGESLYVITEDDKGMATFSSVPLAGGEFTTVLQTKLSKVYVYSTHGPEWLIAATQPPETGRVWYWMSPADGSVREISSGPQISGLLTYAARAEHGYAVYSLNQFYFLPDGADAFVRIDLPCMTDSQSLFELAVDGNNAYANLHDGQAETNAIVRIPLPN